MILQCRLKNSRSPIQPNTYHNEILSQSFSLTTRAIHLNYHKFLRSFLESFNKFNI